MNLHSIVSSYIGAINPSVIGAVSVSNGFTVNADGSTVPTYAVYQSIPMQVQAASGRTLAHLENLNIQGVVRVVYLNGNIEGLDRPAGKGGDLLTFNNQVWLVAAVLEPWDQGGWVKVAVTLQNPVLTQVYPPTRRANFRFPWFILSGLPSYSTQPNV